MDNPSLITFVLHPPYILKRGIRNNIFTEHCHDFVLISTWIYLSSAAHQPKNSKMSNFTDVIKDEGNPGEVKPIVTNPTQGGSTGDSFTLTNNDSAVKELSVWIAKGAGGWSDRDLIKAIEVKWDNKTRSKGNKTGTQHTIKFDDDEKVKELKLWTGNRVDKISLKAENHDHDFVHGGTNGTEHKENIGNGILIGFVGSADSNELVSLGSKFKEAGD